MGLQETQTDGWDLTLHNAHIANCCGYVALHHSQTTASDRQMAGILPYTMHTLPIAVGMLLCITLKPLPVKPLLRAVLKLLLLPELCQTVLLAITQL